MHHFVRRAIGLVPVNEPERSEPDVGAVAAVPAILHIHHEPVVKGRPLRMCVDHASTRTRKGWG